MKTEQVTTGKRAVFKQTYTDHSETNITVEKNTELPITDFETNRVQCQAPCQDGSCPIWVPRNVVEIKK